MSSKNILTKKNLNKKIKCPACKNTVTTVLFKKGNTEKRKCEKCGFIFFVFFDEKLGEIVTSVELFSKKEERGIIDEKEKINTDRILHDKLYVNVIRVTVYEGGLESKELSIRANGKLTEKLFNIIKEFGEEND